MIYIIIQFLFKHIDYYYIYRIHMIYSFIYYTQKSELPSKVIHCDSTCSFTPPPPPPPTSFFQICWCLRKFAILYPPITRLISRKIYKLNAYYMASKSLRIKIIVERCSWVRKVNLPYYKEFSKQCTCTCTCICPKITNYNINWKIIICKNQTHFKNTCFYFHQRCMFVILSKNKPVTMYPC